MSAAELVPVPARGRLFTRTRRARFGDCDAGGHLRLDALARYLQDVSNDDTNDAGLGDAGTWVVRRTVVEVEVAPVYGEAVSLTTFCSGTGSRWAERRVQVTGDRGARVEAASLWVHLDPATGRPARLAPAFAAVYAEAAGDREVSARTVLDPPPPDAPRRPWPTRFADFDLLQHMNNAVYWTALEDQAARHPDLLAGAARRAEVEFRAPVGPSDGVELAWRTGPGRLDVWLVRAGGAVDATVFAAARLQAGAGDDPAAS